MLTFAKNTMRGAGEGGVSACYMGRALSFAAHHLRIIK